RPKKRFSSATMAGLAMASAPIICSTTVPGMRRSMRKIRMVRPARVSAIEYNRTTRYRPKTRLYTRISPRSNHENLRLLQPHALEAVEERRRMLLETLHRCLREVDRVGRVEPEVRHVLEDHDLDAIVDLLALLLIHRAAAVLEEGVQLGNAPAVPVLAFGRMKR